MIPFFRRMSLTSYFSIFSVILLAVALLLSFGFWMQVYHEELSQKYEELATGTDRIDAALTDTFDYSGKYIEFIGSKIVQNDVNDFDYIASFISGNYINRSEEHNLASTTTFDWVTPDKQMRVSAKIGVMHTPFDMSDRDYLTRTAQQPWTLQLSAPRYGSLSRQWIIPGGMGFTDSHGKFVGSIAMGFAIDVLTRRIAQALGPTDMHYLIFTEAGDLVLDSQKENTVPPSDFTFDFSKSNFLKTDAHYFTQPLQHGNTDYSYSHPVGKYPFVILAGYPHGMAHALFLKTVISRLTVFSGIAAAALIMLYFLRRRLIRPVVQLARAADRISKGLPAEMPYSPIRELALLSGQLQKISDYVQNEQRINRALEQSAEQLKIANAEATAAAETARKADRAKSEFLANMSHELRTPMNAVIGLTDILLSKEHPPEKRNQYLQVMQTSAGHLMQLINDLLDIARLEAGKTSLENIPFDLAKVIDDVINISKVQAKQKNIWLEAKILSSPPPKLIGDPHRLQQILLNLLGNAVKFTAKGSVTLELDCHENPVTRNWNISIAVTDTGIGIPAAKLPTIFDKFTQADSSISRTHGGNGLGLSISKMLIEMMQGKISVESTAGIGSRFVIEFPLLTPQAASDDKTSSNETPPAPSDSAHILLVEDHSGNILVATALFDLYGFTYELARTGTEALTEIQAANFDVVLMDIQMPEMDGFEVTRAIREREKALNLPHIPIIGMTAHALSGDRKRCLEAGMDDYISKPFQPEQLVAIIRRFARERGAAKRCAA